MGNEQRRRHLLLVQGKKGGSVFYIDGKEGFSSSYEGLREKRVEARLSRWGRKSSSPIRGSRTDRHKTRKKEKPRDLRRGERKREKGTNLLGGVSPLGYFFHEKFGGGEGGEKKPGEKPILSSPCKS